MQVKVNKRISIAVFVLAALWFVLGLFFWMDTTDDYRMVRRMSYLNERILKKILSPGFNEKARLELEAGPEWSELERWAATYPQRWRDWQNSGGFWALTSGVFLLGLANVLCAVSCRRSPTGDGIAAGVATCLLGAGLVFIIRQYGWDYWSVPCGLMIALLILVFAAYTSFAGSKCFSVRTQLTSEDEKSE